MIPFQLHRLFAGSSYIWGGDLNSAEIMDDQGFVGGNRKLRRIWHDAGSRDDHVFADAVTEARVTDWRIDTAPVTAEPRLSDHAPIWVDLS